MTKAKSKEKVLRVPFLGSDTYTTSIIDTFIDEKYDCLELSGFEMRLVCESVGKEFVFFADWILRTQSPLKSVIGQRVCGYTMTGLKRIAGCVLFDKESLINNQEPLDICGTLIKTCRKECNKLEKLGNGEYLAELEDKIIVSAQSSEARSSYGYGYTDKTFYITHVRMSCVTVLELEQE